MKKYLIIIFALLASISGHSQTMQVRADSVIANKLKVKNISAGLVKASSIGNFSNAVAGTDYVVPSGSISGNSATATQLQTGRTISTSGDVIYASPSFNGTANISGAATVTWVNGFATYSAKYAKGISATAPKTANYTAAVGDLIPCDNTAGSFTITLPTAPPDSSRVSIKLVLQTAPNTITIACGGADVFNKAGGGTTLTITLLNQGYNLQYKASTGIWYVVASDFSLGSLDSRFSVNNASIKYKVIADLNAGLSTSILTLTNSTGVSTDTWPMKLLGLIATKFPAYNIKYAAFVANADPTLGVYPTFTYLQQPGAERCVTLAGSTSAAGLKLASPAIQQISGDIEVRVKINATNYASGATQSIVGKYTATAGTAGFRLALTSTGAMQFLWTTDGTTGTQATRTSTVTLPSVGITNATDTWLRVTLQVSSGGNNLVKFYYGTDDITYTQLGTTVTTAGVTSVFATTTGSWEVGVTGSNSNLFTGKIYSVKILNGIAGFAVTPASIDSWQKYGNTVFAGTPTLTMFIGGYTGATIDVNADPVRLKYMAPFDEYGAVFVANGHNDVNQWGADYLLKWDTYLAEIKSRIVVGDYVFVTENPETSPSVYYEDHAKRQMHLLSWAYKNNLKVIDVFGSFISYSGWQSLINSSDGVHPTKPAGYDFWGKVVWYTLLDIKNSDLPNITK